MVNKDEYIKTVT